MIELVRHKSVNILVKSIIINLDLRIPAKPRSTCSFGCSPVHAWDGLRTCFPRSAITRWRPTFENWCAEDVNQWCTSTFELDDEILGISKRYYWLDHGYDISELYYWLDLISIYRFVGLRWFIANPIPFAAAVSRKVLIFQRCAFRKMRRGMKTHQP